MSTWMAVVIETRGRADFWDVVRQHGVEAAVSGSLGASVPERALVVCEGAFVAPAQVAETLARELSTVAIGFAGQTSADAYTIHVFDGATCVRRLVYSRDGAGWEEVQGRAQPWERVFFFDDEPTDAADGRWPDLLGDELEPADIARYEAARRAGDASGVMELLRPHSLAPFFRVCRFLGVNPERADGRWKKASIWARVFGGAR